MTDIDHTLWLDRALDMAHTRNLEGGTVEQVTIARAFLRLANRVSSLYEAIAHGDAAHRAWLLTEIEKHVNEPVKL